MLSIINSEICWSYQQKLSQILHTGVPDQSRVKYYSFQDYSPPHHPPQPEPKFNIKTWVETAKFSCLNWKVDNIIFWNRKDAYSQERCQKNLTILGEMERFSWPLMETNCWTLTAWTISFSRFFSTCCLHLSTAAAWNWNPILKCSLQPVQHVTINLENIIEYVSLKSL